MEKDKYSTDNMLGIHKIKIQDKEFELKNINYSFKKKFLNTTYKLGSESEKLINQIKKIKQHLISKGDMISKEIKGYKIYFSNDKNELFEKEAKTEEEKEEIINQIKKNKEYIFKSIKYPHKIKDYVFSEKTPLNTIFEFSEKEEEINQKIQNLEIEFSEKLIEIIFENLYEENGELISEKTKEELFENPINQKDLGKQLQFLINFSDKNPTEEDVINHIVKDKQNEKQVPN